MAQVAGRHSEVRTVGGVGTTSGSTALTHSSGFTKSDVGRAVSGTGIPAGATLAAVPSTTTATLSANATATGTITATVGNVSGVGGAALVDAQVVGFLGWSPMTAAEVDSLRVVAVGTDPARITDTTTDRGSLQRSR